ncbi:MAG: ABC transporter ATP-binding protein/permease [Spirochaetes bacterium]|nr:ABC transporter ATP-binding protein/permease [Spirochaetota bacterium]
MSIKLQLTKQLMKRNLLLYIFAIIGVGIASLLSFCWPLLIRTIIDSVIGNQTISLPSFFKNYYLALGGREYFINNLWLCGLILMMISIGEGTFQFFKGKWSAVASENIGRDLRNNLYHHLQKLPFDYFIKAETGDLIQRFTSDVETVRQFLSVQMVEMGRGIFFIAISLMIMLSLDLPMTLAGMMIIPFILVFSFIFFLKVKKYFKISDEAEAKMSTVLQEHLNGIRVVRAFARQNYEMEKFEKENLNYRDQTMGLIKLFAYYWSFSDFFCLIQVLIVILFGTYRAVNGMITLGTMVVFLSYVWMLLWPVRQLGRILSDFGKAVVAFNRITEILQEPPEHAGGSLKPKIKGKIELDRLWFGYDEKNSVLKDISLTIQPGEKVAFLGSTGSGKSSLVHLLLSLYDHQKGSIKIDDIEIDQIDKFCLRNQIGMVLQEPFLFSRSLKDNISITHKDSEEMDELHVFEAARIASIHETIEHFDQGYQTVVGEKGVTLSGGQKQRVAIARTILKDAPILIFDDSLSAVDVETEASIQKALKECKNEVTIIMITHRLTGLQHMDQIYVMDKGEIIQKGTHQQLIAETGLYQKLWYMQSEFNGKN